MSRSRQASCRRMVHATGEELHAAAATVGCPNDEGCPNDVDALPALLRSAPSRFRGALKAAKSGATVSHGDLAALAQTAALEQEGRSCCRAQDRVECVLLANEVETLCGGRRWCLGLQRVQTIAQAACFADSARLWLATWERSANPPPVVAADLVADGGDHLAGPAYVTYDAQEYDFRGLILRMLNDHLPTRACHAPTLPTEWHDQTTAQAEPHGPASAGGLLERLHESELGQREQGFLRDAQQWVQHGLEYSKELDEATRCCHAHTYMHMHACMHVPMCMHAHTCMELGEATW